MKVRLTGSAQVNDVLQYDGVRSNDKLKLFILTDLCTAYVYMRASRHFHYTTNDSNEDRKSQFRDMSVRMARAIALDYLGSNDGTPADQVSRRVGNMVAALEGREQDGTKPATLVTPEQLEITNNFLSSEGRQISVRMSQGMARSMGLAAHAPIRGVADSIVGMLVDSRDEMRMQAVMRLQYDTMQNVLGGLGRIPGEVAIACTRMYLALRCILRSDLLALGDVLEPSFDDGSLREIVPVIGPGPSVENPVILAIGSGTSGLAEGLTRTSWKLGGAPVFRCFRDETDIGIQLYKARLSRDYGGCTLLVLTDEPSDREMIESELARMGWSTPTVILLSNNEIPKGNYRVNTRGKTPSAVSDDVRCLSESGASPDDPGMLSLLCSPYADILSIGYPEIDRERRSLEPESGLEIISERYGRITSGEPVGGTRFDPIVICVREIVLSLINRIVS